MRFRAAHEVGIVGFLGRINHLEFGFRHRPRDGIEYIVLQKHAPVLGNEELLVKVIGRGREVAQIVVTCAEAVVDILEVVFGRAVKRAEPVAQGILVKPHFVIDLGDIEVNGEHVFRALLRFEQKRERALEVVFIQPLVRQSFVRFRAGVELQHNVFGHILTP